MSLNIDHLSEAQLIELSYKVVARLKFLQETRGHQAMPDFRSAGHEALPRTPGSARGLIVDLGDFSPEHISMRSALR